METPKLIDGAIVKITDRARGILAMDAELQLVQQRITNELEQHAITISAERERHDRAMAALQEQRVALEQAIFRLGAI